MIIINQEYGLNLMDCLNNAIKKYKCFIARLQKENKNTMYCFYQPTSFITILD